MDFPRRASQVTPKVVNLYSQLFKGTAITQICGPNQTQDQFYAELLTLTVDPAFIAKELERSSGDSCLTHLKVCFEFVSCIVRLSLGTAVPELMVQSVSTFGPLKR